jgi:hypothetical protein
MIGRFIAGVLAGVLSAGAASAGAPAPQTVPPSAAPAEWVRYAEAVTASVKQRLQAEDETATRLRTYLDATRPAPDQPTAPLEIKLWIDADGAITRIAHARFADASANADLLDLITAQPLPEKPPEGLLLPLRVQIQLKAPVSSIEPALGAVCGNRCHLTLELEAS